MLELRRAILICIVHDVDISQKAFH